MYVRCFRMQNLISAVNKTLWGLPMLLLLIGCGGYLTARLKLFQILKARRWLGETLGSLFGKKEKSVRGISPFQALSSALASTIGSGNLVGIATAIAAGGAGAVFWMWVAAIFGMATKYAEIYLAVYFRRSRGNEYYGGPMYYIEDGLGKGYRPLAVVFSVSGALACIGMGGMNQANSIAAVVTERVDVSPVVVGIILSLVAGISISGGIRRISRTVEKLVPIMAFMYIGVCVFIMVGNPSGVTSAIREIFTSALAPRAVYGALGGEMARRAIHFGVARGVFSNEAGLGSSPIVHAAANAKSPEKQGYWGIFEVFFDTMVICTITAIMVISSGKAVGNITGANLVTAAFGEHLGKLGGAFVGLSVVFFCITTILGWSYYGESCISYLTRGSVRARNIYRALFTVSITFGASFSSDIIWELSDMFNGMMMVPNLIAVFLLSGIVIKNRDENSSRFFSQSIN